MRLIDADELKKCVLKWLPQDPCGREEKVMPFETDICVSMLMEIDEQPTITPEPHWIPVTEATPTEDDDYWATFEAETGRFVDWASWYHGKWVVWLDSYPNPVTNVVAWQKCPEPYKGVTA